VNAEPGDESEDIFGDDSEDNTNEKGDADPFDYQQHFTDLYAKNSKYLQDAPVLTINKHVMVDPPKTPPKPKTPVKMEELLAKTLKKQITQKLRK